MSTAIQGPNAGLPSELAAWMAQGTPRFTGLNQYRSVPSSSVLNLAPLYASPVTALRNTVGVSSSAVEALDGQDHRQAVIARPIEEQRVRDGGLWLVDRDRAVRRPRHSAGIVPTQLSPAGSALVSTTVQGPNAGLATSQSAA